MLVTAFKVDFGCEAGHNSLSIISGNNLYPPQMN